MPLGAAAGFGFSYFKKNNKLTKADILKEYDDDEVLLSYLPDDISKSSLNRNYLLSVSLFYNF